MADYKSKEEKKIESSQNKFMNKVEKEEAKKEKILQNCKSKLQFQFAQNLKKVCKKQGIVGKIAKDKLDISASDLSEYINGKKDVNLEKLEDIANRLNISPFYLLGVTDNPKPISPILSSMIFGLSLEARYSLIMLYYGIKDDDNKIEIEDDETGEIDVNVLPSGDYLKNFEIFSSFISDFSNFCDFFTYITRYVEVKRERNKKENTKIINDGLEEIKEIIQKSIFESLDKIARKGE